MDYKDFRKMWLRAYVRYNIIGFFISMASLLAGGFVVAVVNSYKKQQLENQTVEVPEETTEESED